MPWSRVEGWIDRFDARHPGTTWSVTPELVTGRSPDGSTVGIAVPLGPLSDLSVAGLARHLGKPWRIGIVLVRRGGFAVARVVGSEVTRSKVGQRHVQGRTKAGGWSQQRFARRRDNQARAAFEAAAGHVHDILRARELDLLACGGDRNAVEATLSGERMAALRNLPQTWLGGVPDPRRDVLDEAIERARSVVVQIADSQSGPGIPGSSPELPK